MIKNVRFNSRAIREVVLTECDEDVLAVQEAEEYRTTRNAVYRDLVRGARAAAKVEPPVVTSWLSMSESERAQIRPARRRTPAGHLVLVRGEGSATPAPSGEGEAA